MKPANKLPSQEYLKECFDYDPETGILTFRIRPAHHFKSPRCMNAINTRCAGERVGSIVNDRLVTRMLSKLYGVHRVIWKLVHNEDPDIIDHIDGDGFNNRIANLRNCTQQQNICNKRIPRNNKSGTKGVWYQPRRKKWCAQITAEGKTYFLGRFNCITAAKIAYMKGAVKYHGKFANFGWL